MWAQGDGSMVEDKKIKVVVCTQGSFSLSSEALNILLKKGWVVWPSRKEWEQGEQPAEALVKKKWHGQDCISFPKHWLPEVRSHKDIVGVVESLGDKAAGRMANLVILKIPSDVEWHIANFMGEEYVAEDHRMWTAPNEWDL